MVPGTIWNNAKLGRSLYQLYSPQMIKVQKKRQKILLKRMTIQTVMEIKNRIRTRVINQKINLEKKKRILKILHRRRMITL